MSTRSILAAALSVLATAGTVAFAVPARAADTANVIVSHADLDLASEAGVKQLDRRLRAAASRACRKAGVENLAERMACQRIARADGHAQASVAVARAQTLLAQSRAATSPGA